MLCVWLVGKFALYVAFLSVPTPFRFRICFFASEPVGPPSRCTFFFSIALVPLFLLLLLLLLLVDSLTFFFFFFPVCRSVFNGGDLVVVSLRKHPYPPVLLPRVAPKFTPYDGPFFLAPSGKILQASAGQIFFQAVKAS